MASSIDIDGLMNYYDDKLKQFGNSPRGVDWKSAQAQEVRFDQLMRVIDASKRYSLVDYGSGFGPLYDYLKRKGHSLEYYGYDFLQDMVEEGRRQHAGDPDCRFINQDVELPQVDYAIGSGLFNIRLDASDETWTSHVIGIITRMNQLTSKGFAFNMLTKYSDAEYMRADLYYADPCFFFDHCKQNFAKNVALLHDYGLYDFTILVRKEL